MSDISSDKFYSALGYPVQVDPVLQEASIIARESHTGEYPARESDQNQLPDFPELSILHGSLSFVNNLRRFCSQEG
jgi:hypothetical protein